MREQPELVAIMICERALRDVITQELTLVSLQSHVVIATLPTVMNFCVCISLTNGRGTHEFTGQLVGPEGAGPYPEQPIELTFDGPLDVLEVTWALRDVVIPVYGVYYLEVHCGDRFLGRRALHIQEPRDDG